MRRRRSDLPQPARRFVCDRRMQRAARSGFATSTVRECISVLDRTGAGARREIGRDAPPPFSPIKSKYFRKKFPGILN